jgi:hypothetical protein
MKCTFPSCDDEAVFFYIVKLPNGRIRMRRHCREHDDGLKPMIAETKRVSYEEAVVFEVHDL